MKQISEVKEERVCPKNSRGHGAMAWYEIFKYVDIMGIFYAIMQYKFVYDQSLHTHMCTHTIWYDNKTTITDRAIFVKLRVVVCLISRLLLLVLDIFGGSLVIKQIHVYQSVVDIFVQYTWQRKKHTRAVLSAFARFIWNPLKVCNKIFGECHSDTRSFNRPDTLPK